MQELRVWGGGVANAQEDTLSRRVDENASTLQVVVYKPDHTKGGILIRPKYHRGDRRGVQTFPVLTHMSIRLVPSVMPAEFGWRLPALKQLTLLLDLSVRPRWNRYEPGEARRSIFDDGESYLRTALRTRLGRLVDSGDNGLAARVAATSPSLERVCLDLCSSEDSSQSCLPLLTVCRASMPWDVERLFHLINRKPDPAATGFETAERCHDALRQAWPLLLPLLKAQGWAPAWEVRVAPSPPTAQGLAVLGLTRPPAGLELWPSRGVADEVLVDQLMGWLQLTCASATRDGAPSGAASSASGAVSLA